jgi:hypothetical protein
LANTSLRGRFRLGHMWSIFFAERRSLSSRSTARSIPIPDRMSFGRNGSMQMDIQCCGFGTTRCLPNGAGLETMLAALAGKIPERDDVLRFYPPDRRQRISESMIGGGPLIRPSGTSSPRGKGRPPHRPRWPKVDLPELALAIGADGPEPSVVGHRVRFLGGGAR